LLLNPIADYRVYNAFVRRFRRRMKLNKLSIKAQRSSGHPLKKTELIDMKRRFWAAAALSLPLFILGMTEFIPGDPIRTFVGPRAAMWVSLALATPVVLWGGWPFFVRFWYSLITRSLNMFTLIGLGGRRVLHLQPDRHSAAAGLPAFIS